MGSLLSSGFRAAIFLAFLIGFFVPDPQYCKAGARRSCKGWPSHQPFYALCACQANLDSSEHGRTLDAVGMTIRGEPACGRAYQYSVGPRIRTIMQSCASAADPFFSSAQKPWFEPGPRHLEPSSATRHKRADWAETVRCLQPPTFIAPGAERPIWPHALSHELATRRAEACAPRPRSWSCEYRGRSRCGHETTAPRHCPLLEHEKSPCQLDHTSPNSSVARTRQL